MLRAESCCLGLQVQRLCAKYDIDMCEVEVGIWPGESHMQFRPCLLLAMIILRLVHTGVHYTADLPA